MSILPLFLFLLASGKPEPQPIAYGHDQCDQCGMTITGKKHGSELVTRTSKVYKFDSPECLAWYVLAKGEAADAALLLVPDFNQPGELMDATTATFLQSKKLPSPMAMGLSAFKNNEEAQQVQAVKGGKLYTWPQTLERCKNRDLPE
jgi:copper chaperone NosL